VNCAADKIHISEATKVALEGNSEVEFQVELRGEIDVKVIHAAPVLKYRQT